jgi:hypothetical protein
VTAIYMHGKVNNIVRYAISAGRATTNDELEDMLESGNPAVFTQGVSA